MANIPIFFQRELRTKYLNYAKKRYEKLGHKEYFNKLNIIEQWFINNNSVFNVVPDAALCRKDFNIDDVSNCIFNRGYIDFSLMDLFLDYGEKPFIFFWPSISAFVDSNNVLFLVQWLRDKLTK